LFCILCQFLLLEVDNLLGLCRSLTTPDRFEDNCLVDAIDYEGHLPQLSGAVDNKNTYSGKVLTFSFNLAPDPKGLMIIVGVGKVL
jgi:hypothetical protein